MNITTYKDGSMVIDGTPEEIVLYIKLQEEWSLFYDELKARGISLAEVLTSRGGKNTSDLLEIILGTGGKKNGRKRSNGKAE